MTRRPVMTVFFVMLLAAGYVTATAQGRDILQGPPAASKQTPPPTVPVPEHVITWLMFRQVVTLNRQAEEAEKQWKDGSRFRFRYKNLAGLNDGQSDILNHIAADCYAQVVEQDRKAQFVIDKFRAQVPGGMLALGQTPPPLPAELKEMQKERDRIVIDAYGQLRAAFGDSEFTRFDGFVKQKFAPHVKNLVSSATRREFRPATAPRQLKKHQ